MRIKPGAELLTQFAKKSGTIERTVVSTRWFRPTRVEIKGGELVFDYSEPRQRVKPREGMMEGFVRLANASDEQIAAYARRWGSLHINPPDYPYSNMRPEEWGGFERILYGPNEPLSHWRASAQNVHAILLQASQLDEVCQRSKLATPKLLQNSLVTDLSREVQAQVNGLLFAQIYPQLEWRGDRWAIRMHIQNLGGAIFLQLMMMVARAEGLALCHSCGQPFETNGKRKKYCENCGLAAAQRSASKKLYEKKREIRRRYDSGESPQQIAGALQEQIVRIERWLGLKRSRQKGN
jgi:hypothetical protein